MNLTTIESDYAELLTAILSEGFEDEDRTGTGTYRIAHAYMTHDLSSNTWPLLHCKKLFPGHALKEALWMMSGMTNANDLKEVGVNYWNDFAGIDGDLGKVYGYQMRNGFEVDQLADCLELIMNEPHSRRICMSLWNPSEFSEMALPPCHTFYQFTVTRGWLNLHVYQRSADVFLGLPYDLLLFSFILYFTAKITGKKTGMLHLTIGDAHVYKNHEEAVKQYLYNIEHRNYLRIDSSSNILQHEENFYKFMRAVNNSDTSLQESLNNLFDYAKCLDFNLFDFSKYKPLPFIKAPLAV